MEECKSIERYPLFKISRSGVVRDQNDTVIEPTLDRFGHRVVKIYKKRIREARFELVAKLVLEAFKPYYERHPYYLSVNFFDGNKQNCHIDNLEWDLTIYKPMFIPGVNISYNEFVKMSIFPDLYINGYGIVKDSKGTIFKIRDDKYGYTSVVLPSKYGFTAFGAQIHYLLGLTFLEHPVDVVNLLVNHIDGNKKNNKIDNLEWTTHSGNILHAFATGLRSDNKPIFAMNIQTRQVEEYFSQGEFLRVKGIEDVGTLWYRLRHNSIIKPYHGYYIKYQDDTRPWPEKGVVLPRFKGEPVPILVKDVCTGEVKEYPSVAEASKVLALDSGSVSWKIRAKSLTPYKGYMFKASDSSIDWPKNDKGSTIRNSGSQKKITVRNENTKEEFVCQTLFEAVNKFTNMTAPTWLGDNIRKHGIYKRGDYTFRFTDLRDYNNQQAMSVATDYLKAEPL